MCALFHSRVAEPIPVLEPVPGDFPKIDGAEIAATTYGKRVAGISTIPYVLPGTHIVWLA